jgi:hypothetical protein
MAALKSRIERLEKEQRFQGWLWYERFLEGLTEDQLEAIASQWRFPEPMPEPLPWGPSKLDRLDRKSLLRLWEEDERHFGRRSRITALGSLYPRNYFLNCATMDSRPLRRSCDHQMPSAPRS